MIRLTAVIELEGQAPRALTYESSAREFTLGRDAAADFQIPLSTVSRVHSRITDTDGAYVIEDLGSTHGTLVNGQKLTKGEKKVLRNQDIVELTKARITCHIESASVIEPDSSEGTQAIAARAVEGILGRMGDAQNEGPFLRVLNGADEGKRLVLSGGQSEWSVGRSKDCDLAINDPNVSRRHATVKRDWHGFAIHDLGSKNGVLVNGKRIKKPRRLKDHDEITTGPIKMLYVDPNADLLEALKDVPGFDFDEPNDDPEELEDEASMLGAPAGDDNPEEGGQDEDLYGGEDEFGGPDEQEGFDEFGGDAEGGASPEPMSDESYEQSLSEIDPSLLAHDSGKKGLDALVFLVGALFVLGAAFLLYIILV